MYALSMGEGWGRGRGTRAGQPFPLLLWSLLLFSCVLTRRVLKTQENKRRGEREGGRGRDTRVGEPFPLLLWFLLLFSCVLIRKVIKAQENKRRGGGEHTSSRTFKKITKQEYSMEMKNWSPWN